MTAEAARTMPHTLRRVGTVDETLTGLTVLAGYDDDLAGQSTRLTNRLRDALLHIHSALERLLGPRPLAPSWISRYRTGNSGRSFMRIVQPTVALFTVVAAMSAVQGSGLDSVRSVSFNPSAAAQVVCDAAIENPHYSRGAGSVIFKSRITCRGDAPPVQLRLQGTLGSVAGGSPGNPAQGPPVTRATSDQTQTIPMGATVTFYTPAVDGPKVSGSQTYVGNVVGQIVGPPGVATDGASRAASNYTYVSTP